MVEAARIFLFTGVATSILLMLNTYVLCHYTLECGTIIPSVHFAAVFRFHNKFYSIVTGLFFMTLPLFYILILTFLQSKAGGLLKKYVALIGIATVIGGMVLSIADQVTNYDWVIFKKQMTVIRQYIVQILVWGNLILYYFVNRHLTSSLSLTVYNNFAGTMLAMVYI